MLSYTAAFQSNDYHYAATVSVLDRRGKLEQCLMARRRDWGPLAVTLACAVIYLLFISSLNFWRGGWSSG